MELDVFSEEVNECLITTHKTIKKLIFKILFFITILFFHLNNLHVKMFFSKLVVAILTIGSFLPAISLQAKASL